MFYTLKRTIYTRFHNLTFFSDFWPIFRLYILKSNWNNDLVHRLHRSIVSQRPVVMENILANSETQEPHEQAIIESIHDDEILEYAGEGNDTNSDQIRLIPSLSSSPLGPVANLCSATLGAGVLSLPFGFYQAGLVGGCVLLLLSAVSVLISIDLLVKATIHYKCKTYEDLIQTALGKSARIVTEASILIFCLGCSTAYLISIGDIVGLLFGLNYRTDAMLFIFATICLPLSLLRLMTSLQLASSIGFFSTALLVLNAVMHFLSSSNHAPIKSILWPCSGPMSLLRGCPIFLFAFSCQINVCQIYDELSPSSRPKFQGMTGLAVFLCFILYSSVGVFSLLDFGDAIDANILLNYHPQDSFLTQAAFGGMAVAVICAFPVNIFPARVTLEGFLAQWRATDVLTNIDLVEPLLNGPHEHHTPSPWVEHVLLTLLLTGTSLLLALILPDISIVFGVLGGVPSSLIGFVLPGMLGILMGETTKGYILVIGGSLIGIATTCVTICSVML